MTTHTPGPWNYAADSLREGRFSIYAWGPLAYCGDAAEPGDGEANARLIAAAPELLAALRSAVAIIESMGADASKGRAAIAKATQSNI